MTVRESYEKMGANYDGVLSRLGNEMLIKKFAVKFSSKTQASRILQMQSSRGTQNAHSVLHIH